MADLDESEIPTAGAVQTVADTTNILSRILTSPSGRPGSGVPLSCTALSPPPGESVKMSTTKREHAACPCFGWKAGWGTNRFCRSTSASIESPRPTTIQGQKQTHRRTVRAKRRKVLRQKRQRLLSLGADQEWPGSAVQTGAPHSTQGATPPSTAMNAVRCSVGLTVYLDSPCTTEQSLPAVSGSHSSGNRLRGDSSSGMPSTLSGPPA